MTKPPKKAKQIAQEVELAPDAWPRFERFIKQAAKAGPQHRSKDEQKKPRSKAQTKSKASAG